MMFKFVNSKLVRIPGIGWYDDLSPSQVGLMIDSFLNHNEDDDNFDPLAFNDFLHADLRNDALIKIQKDLNENAFLKPVGDEWPEINKEYLQNLSKKLQS